MPTAPNHSALKRRLDRYFWANKSAEMAYLQAVLATHFRSFARVAVIGGLVRDFAREGRSAFRSDVDLVIDAPVEQVARLARHLTATQNRFGGYGCKVGPWKIDFWALETTWARQYVPVHKLEDIVYCTFFDWDSVAYELWEKKLIFSSGYLDRVKQGTLNINLLPNPSPMGNLIRAIRRLVLWQVSAGSQLRKFIIRHLDEDAFNFIQAKEFDLFHRPVSRHWNSAEEALACLLSESYKEDTRQFSLKLDAPCKEMVVRGPLIIPEMGGTVVEREVASTEHLLQHSYQPLGIRR